MPQPYTLCSFTYNDGYFVHELLEHISSWTLRPTEIIIVDDGSAEPFKSNFKDIPLRLIRLTPNQGITVAKRTGLNAADSEFILSVDCDTRLSANYAETCIALLANNPEIGKASGETVYRAGADTVSRYIATVGDNHNVGHIGETKFIPGNAFAIRRSIWRNVGGFGEHQRSICEDHALCNNLVRNGYKLWADCRARAWQTRKLSRQGMCRRFSLRDNARGLLDNMPAGQPRVAAWMQVMFVESLFNRLELFIKNNELRFIYLDLLLFIYRTSEKLNYAVQQDKISQEAVLAFHAALRGKLEAFPFLWRVLRLDMAEMGIALPVVGGHLAGYADWCQLLAVVDSLAVTRNGVCVLEWLNRVGLPELLAEEKETKKHFTFYHPDGSL